MQLESKADLLIITELVGKLEVQGHPAISASSTLGKEVKFPAQCVLESDREPSLNWN